MTTPAFVDGVSPVVEDPTGLLGGVADDFEEDSLGVGILVRHLLGRPGQLMGLVGGDLSVLPREICGSEVSRHPGHRNEPVGTCTAHPGVMSQKRNGRRVVEEHLPLPFVEYSQTSHPLSLETSRNVLKPNQIFTQVLG